MCFVVSESFKNINWQNQWEEVAQHGLLQRFFTTLLLRDESYNHHRKEKKNKTDIPHTDTHSLRLKSVLRGVRLWGIRPRNLLVCSKPTPCRCRCWASGPSQVWLQFTRRQASLMPKGRNKHASCRIRLQVTWSVFLCKSLALFFLKDPYRKNVAKIDSHKEV